MKRIKKYIMNENNKLFEYNKKSCMGFTVM